MGSRTCVSSPRPCRKPVMTRRAARWHGRPQPGRRRSRPNAPARRPAAADRGHRAIRRGRPRLPGARHVVPRRPGQMERPPRPVRGTVLRPYPGKETAEVHDYHDAGTGVLAATLAGRAPGYTSLGFPDPRQITPTPSTSPAPTANPATKPGTGKAGTAWPSRWRMRGSPSTSPSWRKKERSSDEQRLRQVERRQGHGPGG
jgi:hypothetical protein